MERQRELASSYLTDASFSQQAKLLSSQPASEERLLCSEPNGCQLDHARASREAPRGQNRRGRKPTQTRDEKRTKKNEADRIYRKKQKAEFDKLRGIASRFGGVEKMEHEINAMKAELRRLRGIEQECHVLRLMVTEVRRLEQMKYRFGGIEEMKFKLYGFEQMKSMFGGIEEMVTEINRLKNIEFHYIKYRQMDSRLNHQNAQSFFVQEEDSHGMQYVNFKNQKQGFENEMDWVWSHRDGFDC